VKATKYFQAIRSRPGRAVIKDEWILRLIAAPEREHVQADGRAGMVPSSGAARHLLPQGEKETVHNAFFDRGYKS
jgi:hypothetical protein